ncbi:hypothetical protein KZ829_03545 [Actinoplanes hulinensis]|uniref:Uncharacterized protein n=1 Tax=Actinoplanes hulinensis TaxID=1144547 RepID=A0ABS7AW54_9ACTN|nr:hypothetical protein [Actinoplanes hulinensis]MBW6432814.1 hypothetical protein [Actinoplanes hulinensis]
MRYTRAALAGVVLVGATALGFQLTVGTASADTGRALAVSSIGDIVVDPVRQRLFLSDPSTGEIVATDYAGEVTARKADLPGVRGLTLSADSNTLYAAVDGSGAIVAFSAGELAETARYPLGENVHPEDVAVSGDRIWFGYDAGAADSIGNFGSIDASGMVALHEPSGGTWLYKSAPRVFANSSRLFVAPGPGQGYPHAENVHLYDVSSGATTPSFSRQGVGATVQDAAFAGDGSRLVYAGDGVWSYGLTESRHDRLVSGSYQEVDIAAQGLVAFGQDRHVTVHGHGATLWSAALPYKLAPGGLIWEPGADRLLAVTRNGSEYALHTLTEPPPSPTPSQVTVPADGELAVTGPTSVVNGRPLTLTGTTKNLPIGHTLQVTRQDERLTGAAPEVVGNPVIDSTGAFTFTETPPYLGTFLYRVSYDGSFEKTVRVGVTQFTPALSLDRNGTTYGYKATATLTATLGKTHTNRTVEIWAENPYLTQLIKRATVNSAGKVSVNYVLEYNTTFTVKFTGDAEYAARSVQSRVYTRVSVLLGVSKHYKTRKIGNTKYYHFRTTKDPNFVIGMPRHQGRYQHTVIQRYKGGKWTNYRSGYFPLDRYGKSYLRFAGTYPAGSKWRVRAEYIWNGNDGDMVNATTYGAWKYFTYTK